MSLLYRPKRRLYVSTQTLIRQNYKLRPKGMWTQNIKLKHYTEYQ